MFCEMELIIIKGLEKLIINNITKEIWQDNELILKNMPSEYFLTRIEDMARKKILYVNDDSYICELHYKEYLQRIYIKRVRIKT